MKTASSDEELAFKQKVLWITKWGEPKKALFGQGIVFWGSACYRTLLYLCIVFSCIYHMDAYIDVHLHPTCLMNHFDKISDTRYN